MRYRIISASFLTVALSLTLPVEAAVAAPQALGLVASLAPTPMHCDATGCRADLSAFCLQQQRADPRPGTLYHPAPGTRLTLVVTGRDGTIRRQDAGALSLTDDRGFASITARLSPDALAGMNAASIAIEIGPQAALLPEAKPGDVDPQGTDEVTLATGAHRQKAETFFDQPGRDADAIRLTNDMLNGLPVASRGQADTDGHLLAETLERHQGLPIDPAGIGLAREIQQRCAAKVDVTHQVYSMRNCLEGSHDILTTHVNIDFWESLGGS
jgi:hypothetical protein